MDIIYAYNNGSRSAKALADGLGIKRMKHEGKKLNGIKHLINWGASDIKRPYGEPLEVLNSPVAVKRAANKLETFRVLSEDAFTNIPAFTTDINEAQLWLEQKHAVVCRTVLNGYGGAGIVIAEREDQLVKAPLYTRYIKKKNEFRVHVVDGKAIHIQRKARRKDVPDEQVNWKICNHANGFIFQMENVNLPELGLLEAEAAVDDLGLHFGAVDLVEGIDGKFYVLEVNTAPGIEGTTLQKYVAAFQEIFDNDKAFKEGV